MNGVTKDAVFVAWYARLLRYRQMNVYQKNLVLKPSFVKDRKQFIRKATFFLWQTWARSPGKLLLPLVGPPTTKSLRFFRDFHIVSFEISHIQSHEIVTICILSFNYIRRRLYQMVPIKKT